MSSSDRPPKLSQTPRIPIDPQQLFAAATTFWSRPHARTHDPRDPEVPANETYQDQIRRHVSQLDHHLKSLEHEIDVMLTESEMQEVSHMIGSIRSVIALMWVASTPTTIREVPNHG